MPFLSAITGSPPLPSQGAPVDVSAWDNIQPREIDSFEPVPGEVESDVLRRSRAPLGPLQMLALENAASCAPQHAVGAASSLTSAVERSARMKHPNADIERLIEEAEAFPPGALLERLPNDPMSLILTAYSARGAELGHAFVHASVSDQQALATAAAQRMVRMGASVDASAAASLGLQRGSMLRGSGALGRAIDSCYENLSGPERSTAAREVLERLVLVETPRKGQLFDSTEAMMFAAMPTAASEAIRVFAGELSPEDRTGFRQFLEQRLQFEDEVRPDIATNQLRAWMSQRP
ncbi:MAG: hypothetical protein ACKVPX_04315 [Myxococcaceae bacterium]